MRTLIKMLAGGTVAVVLVTLMLLLPTAGPEPDPIRTDKADNVQFVGVGQSDVFFHFEESADAFDLHVLIVAKADRNDILQTRMRMKDGQRFSMVLHDPEVDDEPLAHTLIFDRVGDSVLATPIEAQRKTMIASLGWPFD